MGLQGGLNPYAYAGSNPVMNTDSTGLILDIIPDIGLAGYSIYSAYNDPTWLNIGAAVFDSAAVFVPFVPAGAGLSVKTSVKATENIKLSEKIPEQFFKPNGGRTAEDFITPHSTKHLYNPTKATNATQFNLNVNVKALREDTMLNFDYASSDIFTQITKYEKKYDFNISTPKTPSGDMRIFINNPKPAASTNFPYYPKDRRK